MSSSAVIVIGRNEGERLRLCLRSLRGSDAQQAAQELQAGRVIYVDSGSEDQSIELARALGAEVVELDQGRPFSAARARNEGLARLQEMMPGVKWVQFVDGDCEISEGWVEAAAEFLEAHADCAAVCGRLRERQPEESAYNRLCDMEWNAPTGEVKACGGIAMYRVAALAEAGGFNPAVIAGEEPELCVRLRQAGWKIHRMARDMAWHDAAMTRFGQWWKRSVRSGYAFALGAHLHGKSPERHYVREVRSNWFWGLVLPVLILLLAWPTRGLALVALAAYGVLAWRIYRHMRSRQFSKRDARVYGAFCVLSKFSGVQGQVRFWMGRILSKPSAIMEYKKPEPAVRL